MQRDINFFSIYRSQPGSEGGRFRIIALSVIAGSIIFIFLIFSIFRISDFVTVIKLREGIESLQTPQVVQGLQKYKTGNEKNTALKSYKKAASDIVSGINSVKGPDTSTLGLIASKEPADVKVTGVKYASGCLTLNCTSTDDESPASFVHALTQSGGFSSVSNSEITKNDKNLYAFDVTIYLKGGSGK